MIRNYADTLYEPLICCCVKLLQELSLKVTKRYVRERFLQHLKDKNEIDSSDVVKLLAAFGVKAAPALMGRAKVRRLACPTIIQTRFGLVTILSRSENERMRVYMPGRGTRDIVRHDLPRRCFALIVLHYDENFTQPDFESAREEEQQSEIAYRNSIIVADHVLTGAQCRSMIRKAERSEQFRRSLVEFKSGDGVRSEQSVLRTSASMYVDPDMRQEIDDVLDNICFSLNIPRSHAGSLQCTRYEPDQEFRMHFDAYEKSGRIYSVVIWLNDDFLGGNLHFPELPLTIAPATGRCVIFRNLDHHGHVICESLHASLPVTLGVKYVVTFHLWEEAVRPLPHAAIEQRVA